MIFDVCEHLRETIAEINDKVVDEFRGIIRAREEADAEAGGPKTFSNQEHLTFTPVTKESFGTWCSDFLEKLKAKE